MRTPLNPPPSTRPVIARLEITRREHRLWGRDEQTPEVNRKPKGVRCCEAWRFLGWIPPLEEESWEYIGSWTSAPRTLEYAEFGGRDAYALSYAMDKHPRRARPLVRNSLRDD